MAGIYTWLRIIFVLISSLVLAGECAAQETSEYEPTSIALKISQIGVVDVGVYIKDQALYLPVTGLFSFLKIQNTPSPGYDSVTGFFINKQAEYVIDRALNRIQYQGKVYDVKPGDLIRTETNLYLRSEYFGVVFGLQCVFDFYSLSAVLTTNNELPVIREMRIEMMRRNISRLKDDLKADTIIRRKYPLFHFGMADWAFVNTQKISGGNDISMNLALGSVIAGGEANLTLNYSNNRPFTAKQQYYLWHYANNSSSLLRQVRLGKIAVQSTSSIFSSLVGVQFTNTPTTFRRSFGTYTLSDRTEPGWIVELYVNTVLVDYQKADASGFFSFEVPLVYGSSSILLRFYGPWGEERSRQQDINIPFNFLPRRKLEYNATIAMVEDSRNSIFSRLILNYGLSNRITVGIGAEYLSSIAGRNMIPFLSYSLRLASNLLISGEYAYDTRFKSIISYTLPMNLHVELNYTSFRKNQRVVVANFLEDRKLVISMPIHKSHLSSLIRLTLDQMFFQQSKNYSGELLFTGSAYGISANITTLAMVYNFIHPSVYSALSLGFRLPARIILIPQTQFDYIRSRFVMIKVEAEKQMFTHGVLKLTYEHNFAVNIRNIQVGFRYDFSFAQTGLTATNGHDGTTIVETARGSLLFDRKTHWIGAENLTSVGKGGIVIQPFLDLNNNGRRDMDEPKVIGLTIHMSGGHITQSIRDSSVRVSDLEPFTSYFIDIDRASFENVAWQIRKPLISVAVDPNQFKLVEIPVSVFGEVSGMVYLAGENGNAGQGRVIVSFYRSDSTLAGRTLTEADGYYNFLGLGPGSYVVRVDEAQLHKLNLVANPGTISFGIARSIDGDQAMGLDFILRPNPDGNKGLPADDNGNR